VLNRRRARCLATALALLATSSLLSSCGAKRTQLFAAQTASAQELTGVTATEVRVGFIVIDQTRLNATLGFTSPDSGDPTAQINALAAEVNRSGGIAGRNLVPVVRTYDALTDSVANEEKLCRAFTEDDRVFAVVLNGMFQETARPCYAAKKTLMLDQTLYPIDTEEAASLAPYLYQPSLPEYGQLLAGLAEAMRAEKFLTKSTRLGVIGIDTAQNRRVAEKELLPTLKSLGATPVDIQWVDPTSSATLQAGQNQAILSFKERKVDRVVLVGGSRLLAFLLTIAIPQKYFPAYAVTTFDNPEFVATQNPEAMQGALGISVLPGADLSSGELEFPFGKGEQRCLDVLAAAGEKFEKRENARQATLYCDAVFLLQRAFDGAEDEPVTAASFAERVAQIGPFENASNYATEFTPGHFAGAAGYRPIRFDEGCSCFQLVGPTRAFPS
jgi:ABC-type branched-subunit amino acid transport system substrate-binding protein